MSDQEPHFPLFFDLGEDLLRKARRVARRARRQARRALSSPLPTEGAGTPRGRGEQPTPQAPASDPPAAPRRP